MIASGTIWHMQLTFGAGRAGCANNPAAPVELQLIPTLGSSWHAADVVTLKGQIKLPGAPAAAGRWSRGYQAAATGGRPLTVTGLTCAHLRQAMSGGEVVLEVYVDGIDITWHTDSEHIEAQVWRATQRHFEAALMAARVGLLQRFLGLERHMVADGGNGRVSVRYRRGAQVAEDILVILRQLMFENLVCHYGGDADAAARKFCEIFHAVWRDHRVQQLGPEYMPMMTPCKAAGDDRAFSPAEHAALSSGATGTAAHDQDWDLTGALSFDDTPTCEGPMLLGPEASPKGKAGSAGAQASQPLPPPPPAPRASAASHTGQPVGAHTQGGGRSAAPGLQALYCAAALLFGAWLTGRKSIGAAGRNKGRRRQQTASPPAGASSWNAGREAPAHTPHTALADRTADRAAEPRQRRPKAGARGARQHHQHQQQQGASTHSHARTTSDQRSGGGASARGSGGSSPPAQPALPAPQAQQQPPTPLEPPAPAVASGATASPPGASRPDRQAETAKPSHGQVQQAAPSPLSQAAPRSRRSSEDPAEQPDGEARRGAAAEPSAAGGRARDAGVACARPGALREPAAPDSEPASDAGPGSGAPSSAEDPGACIVCLDRPWQHGFLHGGSVHIGVCGECLAQLQAPARRRAGGLSCPVCRGKVERTVALFL